LYTYLFKNARVYKTRDPCVKKIGILNTVVFRQILELLIKIAKLQITGTHYKIMFLKAFKITQSILYTVKKRFASFPSPAGMSLTKLSLAGNN
jgi:hypothetical protein